MKAVPQPVVGSNPSIGTSGERVSDKGPAPKAAGAAAAPVLLAENGLPAANQLPEDLIAQILGEGAVADKALLEAALEEPVDSALPQGEIVLAQADIAPPPGDGPANGGGSAESGIPGVSEADLAQAQIRPWGSTLVMNLPDGRVIAVPGYFPGQNIGLPPDVAASGAQIQHVSMTQFETSVARLESTQFQQQGPGANQQANNQANNQGGLNPPAGGNAGGNTAQGGNNDSGGNQGSGQNVDPAIANLIGEGPAGGAAPDAQIQDLLQGDPELARLLQDIGIVQGPDLALRDVKPETPVTPDLPATTDLPRTVDDPQPDPEPLPGPLGDLIPMPLPQPVDPINFVPPPPPPPPPPPVSPSNVGFLGGFGGGSLSAGSGPSALGGSAGSAITRGLATGENGNAFNSADLSGSIGNGFSGSGPSGSLGNSYGVGGLSGNLGASGASNVGGSIGSGYSSGGVGGSLGGAGSSGNVSGSIGGGFSSSGVSGSTGNSYGPEAAASGGVGNSGASGPGGSAGSAVGASGVSANVVSGSITAAAPNPDLAAGGAAAPMQPWYTFKVQGTIHVTYQSLRSYVDSLGGQSSILRFIGSTADDGVYGTDNVIFDDAYNWVHYYQPYYSFTSSYGPSALNVEFYIGSGALTQVTGSFNEVAWSSSGATQNLPGYEGNPFTPAAQHPEMRYIVYNTSIERYYITQGSGKEYEFALTGANDPDFLYLNAGSNDIDTLSFYSDSYNGPSDTGSGNGNYDFVTPYSFRNTNNTHYDENTPANPVGSLNDDTIVLKTPYSRIDGIDVIEARGYGTNDVKLNKLAIVDMVPVSAAGKYVMDVAGDSVDSVTLTDNSSWKYTGIINKASYQFDRGGMEGILTVPKTTDRFGNVQYEFQNSDGTTFLNVSASFGLHPGFYWTDGGWGDDDVTDGNDFMEFPDTQFSNVDFKTGTDTLNMDGYSWNGSAFVYGKTFDFTTAYANGTGGANLKNVEIISSIDDGHGSDLGYNQATATAQQDTMVVNAAFVSSATDANKKLILIGDAADRVTENNFDTEWSWFASNVAGSGTGLTGKTFYQYYSYQYGAYLNVQTHMQVDADINFNGWSGNDVFNKWADLSFTRMHGGRDGNTTDTDTMKLSAAGNFDLTTAASKIWNMEIVDVAGNGLANTVSLNATTLNAITDIDHKLTILGDTTDGAQVLDTGWAYLGNVTWSGTNLLQYTKSGNALYVESDLNIVPTKDFTGTAGSDTLLDYDGRYIGTFAFGAGTDTLGFATTGAYNLTALSGTITGLDVVDAGARSGADTVTVNKAFVAATTDADKLSILGVAGVDGVAISDVTNWMYVGTVTWNPGSGNRNFYQYKTNDGGLNTLSVQNDLAVTPGIFFYGAGLNDVFTAPSHSFTTMSGGTGTDSVVFSDGDYNMVGLQSKMTGMDVIDAASHAGADTVTVNKAFVAGAGENATINVLGTAATDIFQFSDATSWTWVDEVSWDPAGGAAYKDFYQYKATDGTATVNVQKDIVNPGIIFYGTTGTDSFTTPDTSYATLDGGAGIDTLRFASTNFDLTGLESKTANLEVVDGTNAHADTITIDKAFVAGASDANNIITVLGDTTDSVTLNTLTDWSWVGQVSGFGATLYQYKATDGTATLNVQANLAGTPGIFFNGTTGNDGFVAPSLSFISLAAGAGTDWLGVSGTDYDFTASGVAAKISNLEVIDASSNAGANTVVMNKTALGTMTDSSHVLTVIGGATDSLNLTDVATGWTYVGSNIAGTGGMTGKSFMQYLAVPEGYRINIQTELAASIGVYFNGWTADETFSYADLSFNGLHGGRDGNTTDTDALKLTGAGNFNFTGSSTYSKIQNIEVIDVSGNSQANAVTLDLTSLNAITDSDHILTVLGDAASDGVAVTDTGWNFDGVTSGLGATLLQYSKSGSKLYVQANLASKPAQTYTGTTGDNVLLAYDGNFANLAFGAGTDTLQFATSAAYDLTTLTAANISGLEVVDAAGRAGADTVTVNKAFVATATDGVLTIMGTAASDGVALSDATNWMYVGTVDWNPGSGIRSFYQYKTNDNGTATLNVQSDLASTPGIIYYGANLDDVFVAPSHSFTTMVGGTGTDSVVFSDGDYNMVGLQTKMTGMDVIDAASHAGIDTVTVNKAFVVGAGENATINVLGTATVGSKDIFQFSDATSWTWVAEVSGLGTQLYQYKATDGTATVNVQKDITNPGIIFYGTTGDNLFTTPDSSYATLDGGAGTDTLRFASTNFDLTGLESKTANLEVVDGTNAHADTITIDKAFVVGASDANNIITVLGDATDSVTLNNKSQWSWAGEVQGFGQTLYQYKAIDSSATLNVQKDINDPGIFFYGDGSVDKDDKFVAPDLTFDTLVGGTGTDWLGISGTDYDFTQAGVGAKISNLEVIDARSNGGANTVTINKAFAAAVTDSNHILTIIGDNNSDSVVISDLNTNWSWLGTVNGSADFNGLTFQQYRALDNSVTVNVLNSLAGLPSFRMIGDIGGASHDILDTTTLNFALLDGKLGTDFWKILVDGTHDLSTFGSKVDNIEAIDLGGIADGVVLSAEFVRDATSANWLVVQGDLGDVVGVDDTRDSLAFDDNNDWSYAGYVDAGGPWPALHAFRGTTSDNQTVWAYADTDLTTPGIDAVGTSGDDLIRLSTKDYTNVDGGAGFDILKVAGGNIDLTAGSTTVQGIDMIDAGNSGPATTVTVDAASVAASDNKTLYVFGDDNVDSVVATDNWTLAGKAHYTSGNDAYVYKSTSGADTVHLFAETTLDQSGIHLNALTGTSLADAFCARDLNFGAVDGLGGLDRLQFLFGGNIDLTNLGASSLDRVEIIDTKNWSANALVIDASFVHDQGNVSYLLGESGDSFSFGGSETWTESGNYQISPELTLTKYSSTYNGAEVTVFADSNVAHT